jgi:hypothetical protein
MNEVDTKRLYLRGIEILRKEFAHNLSDLQRMGALDAEAVGQIEAVFGLYIKKNGFLPEKPLDNFNKKTNEEEKNEKIIY